MNLRRLLFRIHGWAGFNLGFILLVVCASGTLVTLGDEIDWLLHPEMRAHPPAAAEPTPLTLGEMHRLVRDAYPGQPLSGFQAPPGPRSTAAFTLAFPLPEEHAFVERRVHVDPWTGAIKGETNPLYSVQHHFRLFHKQLFVYGPGVPHGTLVVGFWGLVLLLSAVTGILVYKTWLANLFCLRLGSVRRFWSDLHRLVGVWGLLFSLVIAVTGVWYFAVQIGTALGVEHQAHEAPLTRAFQTPAGAPTSTPGPVDLDALVASVRTEVPDFEPLLGFLPPVAGGAAVLMGTGTGLGAGLDPTGVAAVNPWTAELLMVSADDDPTVVQALAGSISPLHFGDFGGWPTRVLWFVLGVALCVGIVAGVRIWAFRTLRTSKGGPGWADWTLGLAPTVGIVLVSVWFSAYWIDRRIVPADLELVGVATTEVGPWSAELFQEMRGGGPSGAWALRFTAGEGPALLEGAELLVDGRTVPLGTAVGGHRLEAGRVDDPMGAHLRLTGVDGAVHEALLTGTAPPPPSMTTAPLRPTVGVAAVGVGFVVLMLAVGGWWASLYRPQRRTAQVPGGRRTASSRSPRDPATA